MVRNQRAFSLLCSGLLLAAAACSSDSTPQVLIDGGADTGIPPVDTDGGGNADAPVGSLDGGGSDAPATALDCTGQTDGTDCSYEGNPGLICVLGLCLPSSCGDKYVDVGADEECEDGNEIGNDGCTACRYDCSKDEDCADTNVCNGAETCTVATHTCVAGTEAAPATTCKLDGNVDGVCSQGTCVTAGCGNGAMDAGEDCDDKNDDDADGCTKACKFTCKSNTDCDDKDACTGTETCNTTSHKCEAGTAIVCSANGCTGTCDGANGMCTFPDADMDGSTCDKDCMDADPQRFPGGFECKDGKDNDCNAQTIDATAQGCQCYVDGDGDGFAVNTTGAIASGGSCPAKYTRTLPSTSANTDCAGGVATAFPGQTMYYTTPYCNLSYNRICISGTSFDYDCNKVLSSPFPYYRLAAATCVGAASSGICRNRSGYVNAVPECGKGGILRTCSWTKSGCVGSDQGNVARPCK